MGVFVDERQLVLPGELLAEGEEWKGGVNTYKEGDCIYSYVVGLVNIEGDTISVTALKSVYIPKKGDIVVGIVRDIGVTRWIIDLNSPYLGVLNATDVFGRKFSAQKVQLQSFLDIHDVVVAQIVNFDRTTDAILTIKGKGLGKVTRGRLEIITPSKIPRLIGRRGSMINLLKQESGCNIVIGKNGVILIEGPSKDREELVAELIRKIDKEAHVPGLTDRVAEILRSRIK